MGKFSDFLNKSSEFLEKVIPNEIDSGERRISDVLTAAAVGGGLAGGTSLSTTAAAAAGLTQYRLGRGGSGSSGGVGPGAGGGHQGITFESIDALPPIDVEGLLAEMASLNRGEFKANVGIASGEARVVTRGIFDDFNSWLEELAPGQKELVRSSISTVQEFIDTGLPRAVQANALARDAAAQAAGGIRGPVGINRLIYNEAQRDIAGIQYGIGAAQQIVAQAQNVAGQFAAMQSNLGVNYLGQLNQMTTITPAQRVGFAFDERQYQTGVDMFNATGEFNESNANAQLGLGYANLGLQRERFEWEQERAREAERASRFGAIGSLLGAGLGAALAPATGGLSLAMSAGLGASIGGGIGQIAGGNYAGGTNQLLGGLGTYAGYQMGTDQLKLQQQQLQFMQRTYGYQPGLGMPPWAPTSSGWSPYPTSPLAVPGYSGGWYGGSGAR